MSIDMNRLRKSLRTIQIIMIGGSLSGTVLASEIDELGGTDARDSLRFSCVISNQNNDAESLNSSSDISKIDTLDYTSEGNQDQKGIASVDEVTDENGTEQKALVAISEMLKSFNIDKELAQPNIIQALRSLQVENDKLKSLLESTKTEHDKLAIDHKSLEVTYEKLQGLLVTSKNESDEFKIQLQEARKLHIQLKYRSNRERVAIAAGGVFYALYYIAGLFLYSYPADPLKVDL